ncbi:MAG: hypothetical protein LUD83_10300 [Clostridiales bacterium]|nr:hypothetical protein [Clostridiales bacterium]
MMKQRGQFIFIGALCAVLLLLPGCGRVAANSDMPSQPVSAVTPASDASDAAPEAEPEEDPYGDNPYRISGLTLTQEAADSANGDVTLLGRLAPDAETEEGYFTLSQLYDLSDGRIAALYSLSDRQINISEGDAWDVASVQDYLALYDWETGQVEQTVALPEADQNTFSYVEQSGDLLWNWTQYPDGTMTALCYDSGLNQVTRLECSGELFGCVTQDGAWLYYVEDGALMRRATEGSGEGEAVSLQRHFSISYLDGLFPGRTGPSMPSCTAWPGTCSIMTPW